LGLRRGRTGIPSLWFGPTFTFGFGVICRHECDEGG
jgi:hypothetical protein